MTRIHRSLHLLDRYVGIPILAFLRVFFRRHALPPKPKTIALFNSAAIGDTLLQTGVIHDLQRHFFSARFTYFSGPSNYEAACLIPGIEVVSLPIFSPFNAVRLIRKTHFDIWIDFGPWSRLNALYTFCSDSSFTIGFCTPNQYRHFLYDAVAPHKKVHETDNFRSLIALLGIQSRTPPFLVLPHATSTQQDSYIVLHLYAGGSQAKQKEWPDAYWVALIDRLPHPVFLTGSHIDRARCESIRNACQNRDKVHVVAGTLPLRETALLLSNALATVSVDTGIMHLSAILGCKTIALHGPTSPKRWGGIGPKVISIAPKQNSPQLHLGFERIKYSSLDQITVQEVLDKILVPDPQSRV